MTALTILMIADCGNNNILGLVSEMWTSFQTIPVKTTGKINDGITINFTRSKAKV